MSPHPNPSLKWIWLLPVILTIPVVEAASVIYEHSFSGSSTANLGGTSLDASATGMGGTSGARWISSTRFKADGSIATTDSAGSAFVAFSPQNGNIYSISVDTRATPRATTPASHLAYVGISLNSHVGATPDTAAPFSSGHRSISPIARSPDGTPNASNTTNPKYILRRWETSATYILAADHIPTLALDQGVWRLTIELDTTNAGNWQYRWLVDDVNGSTLTSLSVGDWTSFATPTPAISYIQLFNTGQLGSGSFDNFSVTAVPEPATGVLAVAALAAFALKRKRTARRTTMKVLPAVLCCSMPLVARASAEDHYEAYVRNSEDFRRVKQDKEWALKAWPSWTYMPWTYQWHIGYDDASGEWSRTHGYNGTLMDQGHLLQEATRKGRLDWIDKHGLRFYLDHTAGKGVLHLWDGDKVKPHLEQLQGTGVRNVPLNAAAEAGLRDIMKRHIGAVRDSPHRAAYALDDEPSWGHFVRPAMWQITDDPTAYTQWLRGIYGPKAPERGKWLSYDDIRTKLPEWTIADFDASPLMDQWSFNDSYWANLLGRLVEYSNELDPATPCGLVGGQAPNAFGGYDYAKLMRKMQFIESYNIGSSQAIIRSFNPRNSLPTVTTHFHRDTADTIWQAWYYLAHGNRGHIGWVEKWFDGKTPEPWHAEVAPSYLEAERKIGPLMAGAEWKHDGVAIYYSHASIQLGWILDAESHGKTWRQRNSDERLSSAAHVRKAWENMLRDSGLQYDFINYADVIQKGVPQDYKVLILPGVLCLSDSEARAIRTFCEKGGTVIADYLPGLWDQHGKGRKEGGVLDSMFGVSHSPSLSAKDIFGGKYWAEVDQDTNFSWKDYESFLTNKNTSVKDASGFHKAVREMPVGHVASAGKGKAVMMNLSPQWYNAHREAGPERAEKREVFMKHVMAAGVQPWVRISSDQAPVHGYEITYWKQSTDGNPRTILYVCSNPEIRGTSLGGGNSVGLKSDTIPVRLQFNQTKEQVRDERTGEMLGDGREFPLRWKRDEAIVISFEGL
ncbi:beta-galactosidase trimerization domain-containing protein [Luteolibacter sp. SL250]|uniref:beta-galactosidase trimerization domain-containing protein n=1 Tax=Luteolibacter sp. SL250 TaxID=2995170 RepID=UPI0022707807|nr:beta-galactosidase trimerization domain-containing protein [Luteolibacter sp. SL250]WAC19718.1 beta-galactosidase trimerization domain-containing protein [Luteolibacter sp. SL250]